jgi:hypothetical protein
VPHTIRQRVTPLLISVTLTTAVSLTLPTVVWASGQTRGGGRATHGTARARGATPARTPSATPGRRALAPTGPRPIARWRSGYPFLAVGYPYNMGEPDAVPVLSASSDDPYSNDGSENPFPLPSAPSGWLELRLAPGTAQVYVDRYYTGEVADFNRPGGREVEPGSHHIEIRAPGYQTSAFDVRLVPGQGVTYREDLSPLRGSEPPRLAAGSREASGTTFYLIEGCYMGNVPPAQAVLPAGCDPDKVRTMEIHR